MRPYDTATQSSDSWETQPGLLIFTPMTSSEKRKIFTVARLNQEVQQLLERGFGTVWLQAELSNFSQPASGHWYFSLKDSQAQIRCAMFRGRNRYLQFSPEAGDEVLVRGKLGLYAARGDFQLIVEHMEPAGAGKLQAEFERLRRQLQTDGWFDPESKQAVPTRPGRIGVVTSATGAAVQDVLTVLKRRYPVANVVLYPTQVQGSAAAASVARAIERANERAETDVLLLVRGGGSLEDLWSFNELVVATAIRNSDLPIVSGVGHEVDVTIADLVADYRAPTPSAAAETVTPDMEQLLGGLYELENQLRRQWGRVRDAANQRLEQWCARLNNRHPQRLIEQQQQRVDELERRLTRLETQSLTEKHRRIQNLRARLQSNSPKQQLETGRSSLAQQIWRLHNTWQSRHQDASNRLAMAGRALHAVSPLATLDRGYAIVEHDEQVVREASELSPGDAISARLGKGSIQAEVVEIRPTEKTPN